MPIVRTYICEDCNHLIEVVLSQDEWDAPAPWCPQCAERNMRQEFKAPAIGGSHRARAVALAEEIAEQDYGVADMKIEGKEGVRNKVRYKDDKRLPTDMKAEWKGNQEMLESAVALGKEQRLRNGGSGLDVLQSSLKHGDLPDLIEVSKRRSMRVW